MFYGSTRKIFPKIKCIFKLKYSKNKYRTFEDRAFPVAVTTFGIAYILTFLTHSALLMNLDRKQVYYLLLLNCNLSWNFFHVNMGAFFDIGIVYC